MSQSLRGVCIAAETFALSVAGELGVDGEQDARFGGETVQRLVERAGGDVVVADGLGGLRLDRVGQAADGEAGGADGERDGGVPLRAGRGAGVAWGMGVPSRQGEVPVELGFIDLSEREGKSATATGRLFSSGSAQGRDDQRQPAENQAEAAEGDDLDDGAVVDAGDDADQVEAAGEAEDA